MQIKQQQLAESVEYLHTRQLQQRLVHMPDLHALPGHLLTAGMGRQPCVHGFKAEDWRESAGLDSICCLIWNPL